MNLTVQGRVAYAYTGGKTFDPALPTVVFVHGAMNDHSVWNLLARWHAHHGHSVLAPDLPGHMRSMGPALESIEAMAGWLLELLHAAGVRRAVLIGHSMGSLAAMQSALQTKASAASLVVEGLVMLGTCVPMPVPDALLALAKTDVRAAIDRVVTFSFSSLAAKPSFPAPGAWLRGGGRQLMRMVADRSGDPLLFFKDFTACNTYRPAEGFAKALDCPVDLVVGDHDQMTLARAAVPLATASGATLHRIDAGHFMMQEAPVAVLEAIRQATQPARTRGVES